MAAGKNTYNEEKRESKIIFPKYKGCWEEYQVGKRGLDDFWEENQDLKKLGEGRI